MSDSIASLPGVTIDAKDQAELEAAFGVTSNAEELIRQNRGRYSKTQREVLKKDINPALDKQLYEVDDQGTPGELKHDELEKAIGHPVLSAAVRGRGRSAHISYTFLDARGAIEKDVIPFTAAFGTAEEKRKAKAEREKAETPEAAAQQVLTEADAEAAQELREAQAEVKALLEETRAKAEEVLREAEAEAVKIRERAAEEAPAAAEKAEERAEDEGDDGKQRAARSGRSGSGSRSGSRSRSGSGSGSGS